MAKLTQAELEMLGITANNESANNESTTAYDDGIIAAANERANKLREQYVGQFVRTTKRGKTYLGMCDEVCPTPAGIKLGMVAADPNEWVGMLVEPNDTWICNTDLERELARESARLYFDFEIESLRYTIARERANGKNVTALTNRLANLINWRSKL
jgi:hypothetical protein